jgi:hypothetical protein
MKKLSSALVAAVALAVTGLSAAPSYAGAEALNPSSVSPSGTLTPAPWSPGGGVNTTSEHGSW